MTLESILKHFYFEPVNENKFPKFGKAGITDYIFTCKHCSSQSEPMDLHRNIGYRLASHLVKYCKPSASSSELEQQEQEEQEQQGSNQNRNEIF